MAIPSGLSTQVGYIKETAVGTAVTPTTFVPLIDTSLTMERERVESEGVIAGRRVLTSNQWNGGPDTVSGDVQHELYTNGLGVLFEAMFGSVSTSGSSTYTHTFTPGSLSGSALTVQIARAAVDGTLYPFTYSGCKVASWEIGCEADAIATLGLTLVGMNSQVGSRVVADGVTTNASTAITSATAAFANRDVGKSISGTGIPAGATIASVTSATAAVLSAAATAAGSGVSFTIGLPAATASYPSTQKPLKFNHGTITIAGLPASVKSLKLAGDNGLADDRRFIGRTKIKEPLEVNLREYTGSLDVEFENLGLRELFLNGTEAALVVDFTSGADKVTITANVRFDSNAVTGSGKDINMQSVPFKCIASSTDASAITAVLVNTDATP